MRKIFSVIFILFLIYPSIVGWIVDWAWFKQLDHFELFWTRWFTQISLGLFGFVATWVFVWSQLKKVIKAKPFSLKQLREQAEVQISEEAFQKYISWAPVVLAIFPAWLIARVLADRWLFALAFFEPVDFNQTDSVFGNELGFYVFQYPLLQILQNVGMQIIFLTIIMVGILSLFRDVFLDEGKVGLDRSAIKQLLTLGVVYFSFLAFGWFLDRYEVLFNQNGVVWGAGYTAINAQLPAYFLMIICSLGAAVLLFLGRKDGKLSKAVFGVVGYFLLQFLLTDVWPSTIQSLMVEPNELEYERPYLEQNIESTRKAYALERIDVEPFDVSKGLSMKDVDNNPLTIKNVRVWDDDPLLTTYGQIQEIRTYYDFVDVDVDRYEIDGELRQVMLSGRELNSSNLPSQGRSWVNDHLQYTHGHGLTMSPVNVVTEEGLPELFIQDIPPQTLPELPISRPEIYYGEMTNDYVVIGCKESEFDYPKGDENVYTRYDGAGGVAVGGLFRRLLYSLYFGQTELLLTQSIQAESRVLMRRNIKERLQVLAPFLEYDQDPYLILSEGKLYWMMDAYTTTEHYPYSEPIRLKKSQGYSNFNYVRNSVKVVVDAYNGSVDFYISDTKDPIIEFYQRTFPNTFKNLDQLSEDLSSHIRYPTDFFDVQAWMYRAYHMTDPTVFYNKEDMWNMPRELYDGKERTMSSYYLIMKLPGEEKAEFVLLLPFVPTGKDNMISWLAARSDNDNYGKLILYQFPKQRLIYGPRQIEARIDQDPNISQQITLWSQSGSGVVRGNLLVIPIEDSLMYVEPLYLQAESSELPELKRIIVSYDKRIAMEETLAASLRKVFDVDNLYESAKDQDISQESQRSQEVLEEDFPVDMGGLIKKAVQQYELALERQKQGDWAGYGEALRMLEQALVRLDEKAFPVTSEEQQDSADSEDPKEQPDD